MAAAGNRPAAGPAMPGLVEFCQTVSAVTQTHIEPRDMQTIYERYAMRPGGLDVLADKMQAVDPSDIKEWLTNTRRKILAAVGPKDTKDTKRKEKEESSTDDDEADQRAEQLVTALGQLAEKLNYSDFNEVRTFTLRRVRARNAKQRRLTPRAPVGAAAAAGPRVGAAPAAGPPGPPGAPQRPPSPDV
eukprot:TRINITY_DN68145_c0_g1_i1.p2 TRINITY_DN68145_c0_g1~~TRINITY_DN68145_c0_g1_i1.p2  ORF type:complete len:188 (+),score=46.59 TRINITY_DN68145_c0_g1_i1:62-625(+)